MQVPTPAAAGLAALAALLLSGCQAAPAGKRPSVTLADPVSEAPWRKIASAEDAGRLDRLGYAWSEALAEARRGSARQVAAEGPLLDPAAALPRAAPAPGSYRCRLIRLGAAAGRRVKPYRAYSPFFCHVGVEGELLSITKQTGSQRPGGYLWEASDSRMVFLGSVALGDEEVPRGYGEDPRRDMAGVLERVAPFRYRLVIPWPKGDSKLDVFELIPAVEG